MAHFAEIDDNNVVLQIIVISNDEMHDEDGVEDEALGIAFCKSLFGENTNWVQTSYNGNIRSEFAHVGGIYDKTNNRFIKPKPFATAVLTKDFTWDYPFPCPEELKVGPHQWNSKTLNWEAITPAIE